MSIGAKGKICTYTHTRSTITGHYYYIANALAKVAVFIVHETICNLPFQ